MKSEKSRARENSIPPHIFPASLATVIPYPSRRPSTSHQKNETKSQETGKKGEPPPRVPEKLENKEGLLYPLTTTTTILPLPSPPGGNYCATRIASSSRIFSAHSLRLVLRGNGSVNLGGRALRMAHGDYVLSHCPRERRRRRRRNLLRLSRSTSAAAGGGFFLSFRGSFLSLYLPPPESLPRSIERNKGG